MWAVLGAPSPCRPLWIDWPVLLFQAGRWCLGVRGAGSWGICCLHRAASSEGPPTPIPTPTPQLQPGLLGGLVSSPVVVVEMLIICHKQEFPVCPSEHLGEGEVISLFLRSPSPLPGPGAWPAWLYLLPPGHWPLTSMGQGVLGDGVGGVGGGGVGWTGSLKIPRSLPPPALLYTVLDPEQGRTQSKALMLIIPLLRVVKCPLRKPYGAPGWLVSA